VKVFAGENATDEDVVEEVEQAKPDHVEVQVILLDEWQLVSRVSEVRRAQLGSILDS